MSDAAYPNSNAAGPTHTAAALGAPGFRHAPALNSPTLFSDASFPWIPDASSTAFGRSSPGYELMSALER
jgi:hypothetical protein